MVNISCSFINYVFDIIFFIRDVHAVIKSVYPSLPYDAEIIYLKKINGKVHVFDNSNFLSTLEKSIF